MNWVADLIAYMDSHGLNTVEAELEAEEKWGEHVADVAKNLLRLNAKNYMVHVNQDDGSRVFIPYTGGFDRYIAACRDVAEQAYPGFAFSRAARETGGSAVAKSVQPAGA